MNHRASILSLLQGERPASLPFFSGLVHITAAGLESEGLAFPETHRDAAKMARAAASTFRLTALPSAALPFDLCVEAEALGATVDFQKAYSLGFPRALKPSHETSEALLKALQSARPHGDIRSPGRIPLVCQAISQLKIDIGSDAVISAILAGPFTVLSMLVDGAALFNDMKRQTGLVLETLFHLSAFISRAGHAYGNAGADFLTVHEMGGSPDLLGAKRFQEFVLPALSDLIQRLPHPRVLAVCGRLLPVAPSLQASGADALSIDQSNELGRLRALLPDALLFGNLDPVQLLSLGTPRQIRDAMEEARQGGVDAIWPGCDLVPATPIENIQALGS